MKRIPLKGTTAVPARRKLIRPAADVQPTPGNEGGLYFSSAKENIQFIHTGCTMLDCVLGGGYALGRVSNLVGDKSTGKTLLAMEGIANLFLQYPNARCRYNEAESAFDTGYAEALGIPMDRVEMREDCRTVEDFYRDVETWLGTLKPKQPGLYVMDSLDALSDAAEMEREIGDNTYGGAKAKKIGEFFRRKVQDLKSTNVHLLIISQIRDNIGAMFGNKHTRSGGKALDFYVSQVTWLAHTGIMKKTISKVERPIGVHIKAKNTKNKVGLPFRECKFDITFGYGVEDERASREWLQEVGDIAGSKLPVEQLRAHVMAKWYTIERGFIPTRRKYG